MSATQALQLSAVMSTGYSAQMALAPDWANKFYFKKGHPANKNMSQWFGHAMGAMAVANVLALKESTPNKAVMGASAIQFLSAPLLMLHQRNDMKKEMIALNTVNCLLAGGLLAKHAFKK